MLHARLQHTLAATIKWNSKPCSRSGLRLATAGAGACCLSQTRLLVCVCGSAHCGVDCRPCTVVSALPCERSAAVGQEIVVAAHRRCG